MKRPKLARNPLSAAIAANLYTMRFIHRAMHPEIRWWLPR